MSCVICLPSKVDMRSFAWGVFFKPSCDGQERTEHRGHRVTTRVDVTNTIHKSCIRGGTKMIGTAILRNGDEHIQGRRRKGDAAYLGMHNVDAVGTVEVVGAEITAGAGAVGTTGA